MFSCVMFKFKIFHARKGIPKIGESQAISCMLGRNVRVKVGRILVCWLFWVQRPFETIF